MFIRKNLIIPALAGVAFFVPAAQASFSEASGVSAKSGMVQIAQAGAEGAKGGGGAAKGGGGSSQGARGSGGGNAGGQGGQAARAPRGREGGAQRMQRSESSERRSRPSANTERRVTTERPAMSERRNRPSTEGARVQRRSGDTNVVVRDRSRGDGQRHRGVRHSWGPGIYFYFYDGYYHGDCAWVRRKAISTGSAYWWRRYRQCREY